ncbi:hypothetical protein M758_11G156700 [Ceratodon purpureus]|nr:hypothetical protein M758_11G156700 [Ceratodon purpureus]
MALSMFGGRGFDPLEFGSVWDPLSVLDGSTAKFNAKDGHDHATGLVNAAQVDWRETPEAHIFKADLPGMRKEGVKVQVLEGRTLEISGERTREDVQKGDTWHRVERSRGSFMRRFRLPENSNVDDVQANVLDGVLTVTVPKVQKPKPQVRQIEIA